MRPTTPTSPAAFVAAMTERMAAPAERLTVWASAEPRTLEAVAQQSLALAKDLGNALLAGVCQVVAAVTPAEPRPCSCGRRASAPAGGRRRR